MGDDRPIHPFVHRAKTHFPLVVPPQCELLKPTAWIKPCGNVSSPVPCATWSWRVSPAAIAGAAATLIAAVAPATATVVFAATAITTTTANATVTTAAPTAAWWVVSAWWKTARSAALLCAATSCCPAPTPCGRVTVLRSMLSWCWRLLAGLVAG